MSRLGDRLQGMNHGPVECEVVWSGGMHLFDPYTGPSLPSSLNEGESSCPAKATGQYRTRQAVATSTFAIVPSGAPGGWGRA
jgi:hypothetical protein